MKRLVLFAAVACALTAAAPAGAHMQHRSKSILTNLDARAKFQRQVIRHDLHVIRFFRTHRHLLGRQRTAAIARRELRFHRAQLGWTRRELAETLRALETRRARPASVREWVMREHPCLHGIIVRENMTYDATLDYGGGHGNVYEPYGIPQANPGIKMASAGADWRTNPFTQIRWMIGYAIGRYGSECAALAHRIAAGYY